ncbi:outer membrane protein assembly factor BamE [Asticcacaulis sp. AND118]|uniref:outer membrane protein assembly factor BamE n=1 Tax=Asticcacaulis sp. AND118 TaxID=2840468 RepID=UPI001CFF87B6|nr:outer membrane protein assembly factor BamE [Asticcacaulis sp. AND118]UDF02410.1 outer membrane protein assembly factor BamE [Asticcacaulis sp. AND118]
MASKVKPERNLMIKPSTFLALAAVAAAASTLGACAPSVARQGYLAIEANPATDIKVGEDTQTSVRTKFGSPSQVATFDPSVWYYITQTTSKMTYKPATLTSRSVTVVEFDKETQAVKTVKTLSLADSREIALNPNKTPTRGRELTALEQILGNVGRQTITNEEDTNPGGQRRRE